jgi:hypothetical protein
LLEDRIDLETRRRRLTSLGLHAETINSVHHRSDVTARVHLHNQQLESPIIPRSLELKGIQLPILVVQDQIQQEGGLAITVQILYLLGSCLLVYQRYLLPNRNFLVGVLKQYQSFSWLKNQVLDLIPKRPRRDFMALPFLDHYHLVQL